MGNSGASDPRDGAQGRWAAADHKSTITERHSMAFCGCCAPGRRGQTCRIGSPPLRPAFDASVVGPERGSCARSWRRWPAIWKSVGNRSGGMLHRRHLRGGEKRGSKVGATKRGKGTKLMVIADATGLPLAVHTASASPHEVTLVQATLDETLTLGRPRRIIGDRAYDSDPLDQRLAAQGIELISPPAPTSNRPAAAASARDQGRGIRFQ